MSEWKTVDSAPTDNREVLATFEGQFGWVRFVAIAGKFGVSMQGYASPTHWMPLPEPPKK